MHQLQNFSANFFLYINPIFTTRTVQFTMLDCTRLQIVQLSSMHRHKKTAQKAGQTLQLHTRMSLKHGKRVCWWKGDIWVLRLTVCPPPSHLWPWNSKPCWRKLIPALSSCIQRDAQSEALHCAVELINQLWSGWRPFISYPFEFQEFRSWVKPSIQAAIIMLVCWGP